MRLVSAACVIALTVSAGAQVVTNRESTVKTKTLSEKTSKEKWTGKVTGFNGIPFGTSKDAVVEKTGALKCDDKGLSSWCSPKSKDVLFRLGEFTAVPLYIFRDGKLAAGSLGVHFKSTFSAAPSWESARAAFVGEFGEPAHDETSRSSGQVKTTKLGHNKEGYYVPNTETKNVNNLRSCAEWENESGYISVCGMNGKFSGAWIESQTWRALDESERSRFVIKSIKTK